MLRLKDPIIKTFPQVKPRKGNQVGIELEYEGATEKFRMGDFENQSRWKVVEDPSLRNGGVEFVSLPTSSAQLSNLYEQLEYLFKASRAKVTVRCGMHVHVNMTDRTFRDVFNVSTLWTLFEPYIFRKFADGRQDNHFCVPTHVNSTLIDALYKDNLDLRKGIGRPYQEQRRTKKLNHPVFDIEVPVPAPTFAGAGGRMKSVYPLNIRNDSKYSAVNYRPLSTFGTMEYRIAPSTKDVKEIDEFVKFLMRLHTMAYLFDDPVAIIEEWEYDGYASMAKQLGLTLYKSVDPTEVEDAADAAIIIAGHEPVKHTDLQWEIA